MGLRHRGWTRRGPVRRQPTSWPDLVRPNSTSRYQARPAATSLPSPYPLPKEQEEGLGSPGVTVSMLRGDHFRLKARIHRGVRN